MGRELEFIVRSLVELKLQVEELRRRVDDERPLRGWIGEGAVSGALSGGAVSAVRSPQSAVSGPQSAVSVGIEPREAPADHSFMVRPGMSMTDIERLAIEAALKETRGNRRRAAELLGIGERTLYRKLREYQLWPGTNAIE